MDRKWVSLFITFIFIAMTSNLNSSCFCSAQITRVQVLLRLFSPFGRPAIPRKLERDKERDGSNHKEKPAHQYASNHES